MNTQNCPKCGEENPADAVMCWACSTPLGAARANASRPEPAPATQTPTSDKVKRWLSDAVPYTAVAGSVASGWLPRKFRLPVLGASLSVLAAEILRAQWHNRANKAEFDDPARTRENQKAPAVRIAETIIFYAWKEKSTATRIVENGKSLKIYYRLKDKWHEQMVIPRYTWKPIRQQLLRFARQGDFTMGLSQPELWSQEPSKVTDFRAQLTTNAQYESLALQFERSPLEAATGNEWLEETPDVRCLQCRESNPFDAVWCWNCGANLKQQTDPNIRKYWILSTLIIAGFTVLSSSGWWKRRARFPVASVGALFFVVPIVFDKWHTRREDRERKRIEGDKFKMVAPEYETSSARLVNEVLVRAIQEKRPAIRLRENGNVIVSYEVDGQWQQDKVLPAYVWLALRTDLLDRARENVTCQGREYKFQAELSVECEGETLVLRFDGAKQAFPTPDEELICDRCGEPSAPTAIMCWNCYAPLGEQLVK